MWLLEYVSGNEEDEVVAGQYHIIPVDDIYPHDASDECICGPNQDETEFGDPIFQHYPLDGRSLPMHFKSL